MAEAKQKEKRIKDMTLPELQKHILAFTAQVVNQSVQEGLQELVDTAVKRRVADYHDFLVEKGYLQLPEQEEKVPEGGLWLPEGIKS